jgi:zinc transport system ATP-binding protein
VAYVSTYVRRVACLNRRMVVHPADQVTDDLIHQMYQNGGPMQPVRHRHNCPNREETTDEDGDDQQEPRS